MNTEFKTVRLDFNRENYKKNCSQQKGNHYYVEPQGALLSLLSLTGKNADSCMMGTKEKQQNESAEGIKN